jgi:hypothetical protein
MFLHISINVNTHDLLVLLLVLLLTYLSYLVYIFVQSAHRKALDVLNTAGISNRVLRLIERRNRVDQWIKYAGMILTVIFLFAFVLWRR